MPEDVGRQAAYALLEEIDRGGICDSTHQVCLAATTPGQGVVPHRLQADQRSAFVPLLARLLPVTLPVLRAVRCESQAS